MDSIIQWLRERGITEVECLVADMTGNARGKIIPATRFMGGDGMRLPEGVFIQTVMGDWPDNDEELIDPSERDMVLVPDASTLRLVPWVTDPTAQIIHDCFTADGQPMELAPRNVLKRVLALYAERGWQPVVAPELEFYLVQRNTDPDFPLRPPEGRSGRPETVRQPYSIDAVNEFDPIFEDMYDYCETMRLDVDTLIHEAGAAQMEVNFRHGEAISLADQVFLFKRTMREAAMRHGVYATFMAKPMENEPGSAMHVHQSVIDISTGRNIFARDDGQPSPLLLNYIAGLQKYVPAAMAFFAPNVNSYRRIARGHSSPINVQWGFDNRTAGLRVPAAQPDNMRVENRYAGADANPYLALAASLACGLLGIEEGLQPTPPATGSCHNMQMTLPRSLTESLRLLRASPKLHEILGPRFVHAYCSVKEKEYETFFRVISSWEREYLLLNV